MIDGLVVCIIGERFLCFVFCFFFKKKSVADTENDAFDDDDDDELMMIMLFYKRKIRKISLEVFVGTEKDNNKEVVTF